MPLEQDIFTIANDEQFNTIAVRVFNYQYQHNTLYQQFVNSLKIQPSTISDYKQIPCLPIEFFKSHTIITPSTSNDYECVFSSSGTTGQTVSKHYVIDLQLYETSFLKSFAQFYGNPKDYCILALLPNYLERQGSSLVYMAEKLIQLSEHSLSGFFLHNLTDLISTIHQLKEQGQKTILLGVSYALLDLADQGIVLNDNFIVMETGGMKGKRQELLKEELHAILKTQLHVSSIHSEYGMTELLSQAYASQNGLFQCPPWMKVMIRDTHDPLSYRHDYKTGGINVIDLANIHSCSFIATQDLGKRNNDNVFEVVGRFDNSDIRGCNLMMI